MDVKPFKPFTKNFRFLKMRNVTLLTFIYFFNVSNTTPSFVSNFKSVQITL